MKIFKDYTLKWYDAGILKWTMLFIGLYIGSKWAPVFEGWDKILLTLSVIGVVYLVTKYRHQIGK